MKSYESIFIVPTDLPAPRVDELIEKLKTVVTKQNGENLAVEKWGRRRLAYPIKRHREGFYIYWTFKAPGVVLGELTQFYRVTDEVIRSMTCLAVVPSPVRPAPALPAAHGTVAAAAPAAATPETPKETTHVEPTAPTTPA